MLPIFRLALTGIAMGPSVFNIAEILGKQETLSRLIKAMKFLKMSLIKVEGIRVYAYHGHLPEEATLGGHFRLNVYVTLTSLVESSDNLSDTIDL